MNEQTRPWLYLSGGRPGCLQTEIGPVKPGRPQEWPADPGRRLGAHVIDGSLSLIAFLASLLVGSLAPDVLGALPILVIVGVYVLYYPVMTTLYGGTVGKIVCGLRVARLSDGEHLTYWQAFGRHILDIPFRVVWPLGLVDVLMCTWDRPYYQCVHDKIVKSVVVVRIPR